MEKLVKVIKVLINTLMTLIIIIGILFIILYIIGIEPFVVESGSMEPTIQTGSLSFINKHVKYEEIKSQDVIAFQIENGSKVTHRVIEITQEGMKTKGDSNELPDGTTIKEKDYIGKNEFSIPKVGYLVKAIQTIKGKIILGTIIVVMLIAGFLIGEPPKGRHSKEDEKNKKEIDEKTNNQ